ncbi:WD40 repeat domain-containing serine/threonine-protein kinase [Rubripirellula reticaptiva]|uniref:Serine/threonine-protein kinase PrkC n=1 Tax=Rubripirellula reticaptiva TaxID=2528013 RepID=A0A5C6ES98_9BACT|nr:WD40 repeat domain-containing serine/threonine-protein kinase [Rubripirellula reticaptiva]TWU51878.1 Serine/threonine-protein kinase PrkC [Rubripirellula reticaptiva]
MNHNADDANCDDANDDNPNSLADSDVLIGQIAEEFLAAGRTGDPPSLNDFVGSHPAVIANPAIEKSLRRMLETIRLLHGLGGESSMDEKHVESTSSPDAGWPEIEDYQLLRVAGRGGMGVVYEAIQVPLSRKVALKVLPAHTTGNPSAVARFQQEARAAAQLHHTNIVPVFEVGDDGKHCYYAMQFIEGHSLDAVIRQLRKIRDIDSSKSRHGLPEEVSEGLAINTNAMVNDNHLSLDAQLETTCYTTLLETPQTRPVLDGDDTVPIARGSSTLTVSGHSKPFFRNVARIGHQIADGLQHAHERGIVHRDIKPSNIILDPKGVAWITDFGLAKTDDVDLTRDGDVVGTLRYMSPERFGGTCDASSDIYSLGVTLYEMLALQSPFAAYDRFSLLSAIRDKHPAPLRSLNHRVPRDLQTIIDKAMEKEPRRRYRTAAAMASDLERFLDGRPIRARRVGSAERMWLWSKNNVGLASSIATIVVVLIVASLVSTVQAVRLSEANIRTTAEAGRAMRAEAVAIDERVMAQRALAKSQLEVAEKEFERGKFMEAKKIVDDTPEQFRDSNWNFLKNHSSDSVWQLNIPGHGSVRHFDYSPQSNHLAAVLHQRAGGVFSLDGKQVGDSIPGYAIYGDIAGSMDGEKIAFPVSENEIIVQELLTGKILHRWPCQTYQWSNVLMSPNGQVTLATMKGQLTAFETHTGNPLWTRKWNGVLPDFSLDSKRVAVVTERKNLDFKIEIIEMSTGGVSKTFEVTSDKPSLAQLQFTQNGWLSCYGDNELIILNATSGVKIRALHFMGDEVRRLSPSGAVVATNNANRIRLWDTKSGRLLRSLNGLIPLPWKVKFSPDGAMLLSARAAADGDGIVDFWSTRLEEEVAEIATGDVLNSASRFFDCRVAFDLDGSSVYKLRNILVEAWPIGAKRQEWIARSNGELFSDMAVHPNDGTVMVSENIKPTFTHLSVTGEELPPFGTSKSSSVQFNRGGEFLLTVKSAFAKVRPGKGASLFDYATGDELWKNDDIDRPFAVFCLSDRAVATAALAGGIDVWDWKLNERLFQIDASQTESISCLAASPDGRLLATGGLDRWIRVWDLSTRTLKTAFRAHWDAVSCLEFSLDGRELLSGGTGGIVRIHDATTGDEKLALYGLSTSVADVDFSPDGTQIAAIGKDGLVKIWDREVSNLNATQPFRHRTALSMDRSDH